MLRDMTPTLKRNVAAAVVAVAVLGGGAAAVAAEGPSRPTLAAGSETPIRAQAQAAQTEGQGDEARPNRPARPDRPNRPARPDRLGHPLARRAVHGELIVRGEEGEFESVTFDRGRLTSVADGSLTLERPDGVSVTVRLNDATRYRGVDSAAALQTGRPVLVTSKEGTATQVAQRPEREGRVPRSGPTE